MDPDQTIRPTDEQIADYIADKGWPTWASIRYDHLDTDDERLKLETAVNAARRFVEFLKTNKRPAALIMLASGVDGDIDRTGYGCGKTTLAKIIHFAAAYIQQLTDSDVFWIQPYGKFYTSRDLMAAFDADADKLYAHMRGFGRLLVIDDVGREGTLRWEKRDPEMQLEEKRDRYYTIINHCYEKGISLVITSNMSSRELAAFLGGASWSRLLQMCPPEYRVNMTGVRDMRPLLVNDWSEQVNADERAALVIR